jgi:hypothetical protein
MNVALASIPVLEVRVTGRVFEADRQHRSPLLTAAAMRRRPPPCTDGRYRDRGGPPLPDRRGQRQPLATGVEPLTGGIAPMLTTLSLTDRYCL